MPDIRHRLEKLERRLGEGLLTVYMEDGSIAVVPKKEVLELLCSAIEFNVLDDSDHDATVDFLRQVADTDQNDRTIRVAKKIAAGQGVRV